ncbi:heme-binding domain-containing protein [Tenacibaculum caenipelagi]|uniref:Heme-binding protein n=1 Tax=Tenacibaculum caenipelagi TaxID=1325435 RepID=A0A4R6TPJ1_9FLAO|nr:heme-binding domain-containing protein [Tenacibaculum caenipelagi]TDQ30209.1 heme-binding protein [Tenacibaculum caenipelagi]
MGILKKIIGLLLVLLVILQFFQPEKNESEVTTLEPFIAEVNPSKEVHQILKTACFDCHTNTTNYPWYSSVTPVNYWMANHVSEGKEELNFSDWASYSLKKKKHKMKEVWEEVEKKKMLLNSYTWTHTNAKLTQEQIQQVVDWAKEVQSKYEQQLAN